MHYESRRKWRQGHTTRRYYKRCLNRAKRRLAKASLRHHGVPLPSLDRGVEHARGELGWGADWRSKSHNTKPRYKDKRR